MSDYPKGKDLSGLMFGRLKVLRYSHRNKSSREMWECVCTCPAGTIRLVQGVNLINGNSKSCGCLHKETVAKTISNRLANNRQKMIGKTYNRLTILGVDHIDGSKTYYQCACICGNNCVVLHSRITSGRTASCGCYRKEIRTKHGRYGHRLYRIWNNMKQRCYSAQHPAYQYYGGRGIIICEEWKTDFKNFYTWAVSNGYDPNLSIDRYPNKDGNYEPGNCRWATHTEQMQNTRRNVILSMLMADAIRRDSRSCAVISQEYGVSKTTIERLKSWKTWKNSDAG